MKYTNLLLLIFFFFIYKTKASIIDNYIVNYYNVENGLPNNSITRIITDDKGYIWYASSKGVCKYDGKNYQYLQSSEKYQELLSDDIETIYHGIDDILWVGTKSGGFSSYDIKKDIFKNYNNLLKEKLEGRNRTQLRVTSIFQAKDGTLYVGTWASGFFVINASLKKIIDYKDINRPILSIQIDNQKNVWFSSGEKWFRYDHKRFKEFKNKKITWINTICYDDKRDLFYIGDFNGVFMFSKEDFEVQKIDSQLSFGLVNALKIDNQGRLWAGSWRDGLFQSNPERSEFSKIDLLPLNENNENYEGITDIHIDKNKNIWIATIHGGVIKLSENKGINKIANHSKLNIGLEDNNINAICVDAKDNWWIGTKNGGLSYKKKGSKRFETLPSTKGIRISAFIEVDNKMYVGTPKGLLIFDTHNIKKEPKFHTSFKLKKIKALYVDDTNNLWIGLQQNGLGKINLNDKFAVDNITYYNSQQEGKLFLDTDRVEQICRGANNSIWLGSFNGIFKYEAEEDKFKAINLRDHLKYASKVITSFKTSEDGKRLFIGVSDGLLALKIVNEEVEYDHFYNKEAGLESEYINAIVLENEKYIWLGHSKGISRIDTEKKSVINFSKEYGVDISSINYNSSFSHKDMIYFGGEKGMIIFSPGYVSIPQHSPSVTFTSLQVDNQFVEVGKPIEDAVILHESLPFTKQIHLNYKHKVSVISFTPTDFEDNKNITYYYRIKGISDKWINNHNSQQITITQLNSGNYTLEVKVTRQGLEFGPINSLIINITPAPWWSTTAKVIYFILIVVILYSIYSFLLRKQALENKLKIARLEKEKEKEIIDIKMLFFTNVSHEIRTPLTLINSPLEDLINDIQLSPLHKRRLSIMKKNTDKLLQLVNQLLDFRKLENNKLQLNEAYYSISALLNDQYQEFSSYAQAQQIEFKYNNNLDVEKRYLFDREKIVTIINNLLSNAFKFTSKGGKIELSIQNINQDELEIIVKDNGCGIPEQEQNKIFQRYYQVNDKELGQQGGTGIGLFLVKTFVKAHKGKLILESEKNQGSKFIIQLPLKSKKEETQEDFSKEQNQKFMEENLVIQNKTSYLSSKKYNLLLVDDNPDILEYLMETFSSEYKIFSANNGRKAFDIALENEVDLIISDIMMPIMNGIDFCKQLKVNDKTAHMPVLLLTAKTTLENELEGLESGANDYIRKPFNSKIILQKVKRILQQRDLTLAFYQQQLKPSSKINEPQFINEKLPSIDNEFLSKAISFVEDNIENDALTVNFLGDYLCMSQPTLYRKIKKLTNQSIVAFIRSIRLKKAAELLLSTADSEIIVAEKVGINDVRYFRKEFEKQYNFSPISYKDNIYINS